MGHHVIKVPDVGEGVAEVELVAWFVAVGQEVTRNQVLAEVMTDKANVEIPSPHDGVVAALNGEIGATLAVGSGLIELALDGAVVDGPEPAVAAIDAPATSRSPAPPTVSAEPAPLPPAVPLSAAVPGAARPPRAEGERPRATPAVRHRARQAGIDLRRVTGTGPAGRITHDDLDAYFALGRANGSAPSMVIGGHRRRARESVDEQPIIGIRRQIAKRMLASTTSIPHITYVEEVDVSALEDLRRTLNQGRRDDQTYLTLLPFLIRALVNNIADFPIMNAHVDDERGVLRTFGPINVGVATQTDNGLLVPVVHNAEADSIWALAARLAELTEAARSGKARPSDLSGSTITITSLGALGGLMSTPIINKPEVAIIGVNKIATRPLWVDNAFVPRKMMNLSSSFDHRVIDGWDAASFVQEIRASLEQPALLFLDES